MYDYLTEELCRELGVLDPDWFQVLTTRASSKEGNLSDSDDQEELCPNQEANFNTPLRKTAAADVAQSQHSSIPRVFRRSYVPSPDNEDQQENEPLPWDTRSPCLFGLAKDAVPNSNYGYARPRTPNWFDLPHTPQVSPASYAQHISESLGADINLDISWTSSLNTPPALPSTLIISKTNESPSPTTFCMGKSAVLVRKLFPSLSNDSRQGVASPQSNDPLEVLQESDCPEAGPHPTLQKSPRRSPEHSNGTRRQPLPEAILSPPPSVPDGSENSLPVFLTNSSLPLRRVKSERTRRREEKEHGSSPSDVSIESELAFSEQRESDEALCGHPPVETEDSGLTPWSPLPLSEIPATTVATQVEDKCTTRAESPVRASLKCAGFTQKKAAFIYTVDKEKHSLKNNSVQGHKLPVTQMSKANDGAGVCNVGDGKDELQQRGAVAKEKLPSLLGENTKDWEMSQLCQAFAQDLSQMSYPAPQARPPTPPPRGFSPFACLTALRVARRKAKRQVGLHGEVPLDESVDELAPSDGGFLPAGADVSHATAARAGKRELRHRRTFESTPTKQHELCLEEVLLRMWTDTKDKTQPRGSFKDSAHPLVSLQSNACERTREIVNDSLPSIQVSGFKTTWNQSMQISAADPQKDQQLFDVCDVQRQPVKSVPEKETPATTHSAFSRPGSLSEKCMWKNSDENGREREETLQGVHGSFQQAQIVPKSPANVSTGACQADDAISCDRDPKEEIPAGSSPPPSCPPSASQNNLPFDSYNINESHQGSSSFVKPVQDAAKSPANAVARQGDQAFECARDATEEIPAASAPASRAQNCDRSNCQLTASQKADVKALCTLLEEAGSQFDFTQFRSVKLKQPGKEASAPSSKANKDLDPHLLSGIDFEDDFCAEPNEKTTLTSCGTTPLEEPAVARQHTTEKGERAKESVLRVSKKCLKKTKHLFQHLEARTPAQKQSVANDGPAPRVSRNERQLVDGDDTEEPLRGFFSSAEPEGFRMASGKSVLISPRAMQMGHTVFKDCADENGPRPVGTEPLVNVAGSSSASPTLVSSVGGCSGSSNAFRTDGGKRESVSSESSAKQRSFSGIKRVDRQPGGSPFAGGKRVSPAAPKKTESLLDVCHQVEEHPACDRAFGKSELPPTSGKPRRFSARDPFDKPGSTSKSLSVCGGKTDDGQRGNAADAQAAEGQLHPVEKEKPEHQKSENSASSWLEADFSTWGGAGFSAAGGESASASAVALTKTKPLAQEDPGDHPSAELKAGTLSSLEGVDHQPDGFRTAKGKRVAVSSAALKKAKLLLDDCSEVKEHPVCYPTATTSELLSDNSLFADDCLFDDLDCTPGSPSAPGVKDAKTANAAIGDKIDCPNHQVENGQRDNNVANRANPSSEIDSSSLLSVGGFSTAGGRSLSVSDEAMTRAKSLFNDLEDENQKLHRNASLQHAKRDGPQNAGLQTADGGRAPVASAALKKSKSFFAESRESTSRCGFSTAGGKKVLVSDRAVARAKSLLDQSVMDKDAGFRFSAAEKKANRPPSEEWDDQPGAGPSKISHGGFGAASGKPVSFSTEALQKAKALFDDVGLSQGVRAGAQGKTFSVPSVSGGPSACSREEKPAAADEEADRHGQEPSAAVGGGTIPTPEEPATVNLESLDLTDCTETQQLFLAQEALDCTKALLLDESLSGTSMTLENLRPKNASCPPAREKRSADATDLAGQPPSKRRLLEEFDRSLDSRRGSTLRPQTSSPKGLLKDRPVFTYDVSLGPNITGPHGDGTASAAAAASSQSQPVGLTLPFFKKTEARPRRSDITTPPAFLPPFKRHGTVVEQDSTKLFSKKTTLNSEDPPTTAPDQSMTNPFCGRIPPTDASWGQGTPLANAELARDMQDMRIRKKTRQTVRPLPGGLFRAKTSGATRIRLKDAAARRPPAKYTQKQLYEYGVHRHVCNITSETAEAFRFRLELFFGKDAFTDESGIQLADGGRLIPSKDGTAGKEQFCRALCDTPGVDPKLLADEWVYNHYRWIVWKLASMERSFPQTLGGRCLTPERVLLQLKYRYDVEVDHSRRPALRKIVEKDDTAAKTLVLCICGVVSQDRVANPCAVVWLTDGWYSVKAQLDEPLSALLRKGRLAAGGKLIIHGAQLVGLQEACAPLEAPQSLMLKIFANSSRPARWDTKLGFYKDPRPFLLPLSSLFSNGGPVGCVDIVVLRSYPVQWMERKSDGGVVFRLARAEEEEEARHNVHKQKAMEVLYAKIQAEFEQEDIDRKRQLRRRTVNHRDIGSLQDGQELYEAVGDDLAGLEALLSERQLETLRAYSRSLMDRRRAEMQDRYRRATEKTTDGDQASCPQRDVTPVWRLCVADSLNPTGDVYQLNLWRPSSDVRALLKEGCRYKVYNLATSDRKKRGAVGALQLTATKKTQFQDLQASAEWLSACFQPRVSTDFVALQNLEFDPPCGEVDLTGCVVSVLDGKGPSPAFYLVDGNVNFVKVLCFSSLLQAGLADVVKPGALLALSNLQLRGRSTRPTPVVYAGDLTVFSAKPKEEHLQKALGRLRDLLQEQEKFFVCAEDKLSQVLKRDASSPALPPKTPPMQHVWTNTTSQQPVRSLGSFTPPSRNLQPAADTSSSEKDPRSLKRRRAVDYLSRMPSPPPLFLPPGLAASPFVKKTFNPPRRASTPRTFKTVHTPNLAPMSASPPDEKEEEAWVNDHELAMIDTQALHSNEAL